MSAFWNRLDRLPPDQRTILSSYYEGSMTREAAGTDLRLALMHPTDVERWLDDADTEQSLNDFNYVGSRHHY